MTSAQPTTDSASAAESDFHGTWYQSLVRNVNDAVVEFELVDGEPIVRTVNRAFVETFGYQQDAVVDEPLNDLIVPQWLRDQAATLDEQTAAGEITSQQVRRKTADGLRTFAHRSVPVDDDTQDIDGVAIYTDITERIENERRLEAQCENLEVLNQVICHDVRNDLQTVLAYAELLDSELDGQAGLYNDRILTSAQSAIDRTNSARTVAEAMVNVPAVQEPVDFEATLDSELSDVRTMYDDALIRTEGSIPDVDVIADEMLGSVFRNLLTNAIEHSDKPVPEVTVSVDDVLGKVVARIADDGPGIPDDRKKHLFERGKKGLDSRGTGLGLYLVSTLVDRYEGTIRVQDNDAGGTTFVVELPIASRTRDV